MVNGFYVQDANQLIRKRNLQYVLVALFIVVNIFIWSAVAHADRRGLLTVAFLDVGQGDAIYIEAPNGNQMLIDGGPSSGALLRAIGQVMPFWDRSLDVVLATHPDQDHVGGFPALLESMNIENVVTTENTATTGAYRAFEDGVFEEGAHCVLARAGERIILDDGVVLEVLFPNKNAKGWDTNTSSIVARLSYGSTSFLLTGDSPQSIEQYLINKESGKINADVLKLAHHGSKTASSKLFLSAVDPEYAVISVGKDNKYGHPNKEVLDLLADFKISTLSTIDRGTILFETDGGNLYLR
ncbi:MAG: MBL fold metallo-hydrolase [Candidatus Pacebacteria bacterium]|jgi:competence protein ComEC|nr:MBL fold metallo-hydrolase [Candidatus Paceibacterota bacterium]